MEIILNISNCETQKSVPLAPFLENTLLLSLCISSCLHLCHISLSSSFCCLFLTVCLEENNITPCYWMNFLHVSMHAYAQMPAGKRWLGMWLCVLVTNSIHAQLFSMSMWTCSCVRVYEYVLVHMWRSLVDWGRTPSSINLPLPVSPHWPELLSSYKPLWSAAPHQALAF